MEQNSRFDSTNNQLLSIPAADTELSLGDEIEIDDDFSFDGFQVVRGEFFAHLREPAITFNKEQIGKTTTY